MNKVKKLFGLKKELGQSPDFSEQGLTLKLNFSATPFKYQIIQRIEAPK
jgi:hypothetical protein